MTPTKAREDWKGIVSSFYIYFLRFVLWPFLYFVSLLSFPMTIKISLMLPITDCRPPMSPSQYKPPANAIEVDLLYVVPSRCTTTLLFCDVSICPLSIFYLFYMNLDNNPRVLFFSGNEAALRCAASKSSNGKISNELLSLLILSVSGKFVHTNCTPVTLFTMHSVMWTSQNRLILTHNN